jgi:2'-5' RNA ligase
MRADLVPHCRLLSHLTLLPPRGLAAPTETLEATLMERLPLVRPFEVRLSGIQEFARTKVVYLALDGGQETAIRTYHDLAVGPLACEERFEYHPHVTLAQEFPHEQFEEVKQEAKRRWAEWTGPRSFVVEELVFVRNRDVTTWDPIADYQLGNGTRPFRAIKATATPVR